MRKSSSTGQAPLPSLVELSRNASVISTSSSDSGSIVPALPETPHRPRPIRTITSPQMQSPPPKTPTKTAPPPEYLTKDLSRRTDTSPNASKSKSRSKSRGPNVEANDFEFGEYLGEGAYSEVRSAVHKSSGRLFAIKILDKGHLSRKNKLNVALVEKNALVRLAMGHPGIVRLHYTFQDSWSLYFVLDIAQHGELQSLVSRLGSLNLACTRYYTAQIVDAVGFMHDKGVVHRDLKPENLLLDINNRLKITDFGTAQILGSTMEAEKFVGTAQYVAPELVEKNETSKSSDLWAIGCVVFQMISGRFAFHGLSEYLILQKVKAMDYSFPEGFDAEAKSLVESLLVRDPAQRLGASDPGIRQLRSHPFLSPVSWDTLWTMDAPAHEAGMLQKQQASPQDDRRWNDVGAAWDNLVSRDEPDGLSLVESEVSSPLSIPVPVPTLLKTPSTDDLESSSGSGSSATSTLKTETDTTTEGIAALTLDIPSLSLEESSPAGSGSEMLERGRSPMKTPIQGNTPEVSLPTSLRYTTGESTIYTSTIEVKSLRRRASKLLPLSVSPIKAKLRELVLTNKRVILFKLKPGSDLVGELSVKLELHLPGAGNTGKAGDWISAVQVKSGREFVIVTPTRSYTYAASDADAAAEWMKRIKSALEASTKTDSGDTDSTHTASNPTIS